jgi:hypothetical protein
MPAFLGQTIVIEGSSATTCRYRPGDFFARE